MTRRGINRTALGAASAYLARVAGAVLSVGVSLALARLLGADGVGVYFLAITIVSICAIIARLGLDQAALRYASIAIDAGDRDALVSLYRTTVRVVCLFSIALALMIWAAAPVLPFGGSGRDALQDILPVMLVGVVGIALTSLQSEFFKAKGAPGTSVFLQSVLLPIIYLAGILIVSGLSEVTLAKVALIYAASQGLTMVVAFGLWRARNFSPFGWFRTYDLRRLMGTALPMLWVAAINQVMQWTDILTLGYWLEPDQVGIYGIANRIALLIGFVLIAANSVVAPRFAVYFTKGDHAAMDRLARQGAFWMLVAAAPLILIAMLAPAFILSFFGPAFVEGSLVVRILALGQAINIIVGSVGSLLVMSDNAHIMRNAILLTALLNLGGNLLLIPHYGLIGAAAVTAVSLALLNAILFVSVYRRLGVNTLGYLVRGLK